MAAVRPDLTAFEPTRAEALRRLERVDPSDYARSRNRLDGAVTGLSPYLTHGLISLPEAAAVIADRHRLTPQDRLVAEFGWREFFQQVWDRQAEAILDDLRPTLPWPGRYAPQVPQDVREGRSGVGAIDQAVRTLYATGYLHNHARLWLASYLVHVRKVQWRAGADWMWAHLLDGDLASNHLSWQWVAGTFATKPYLFNADNVARFAPAHDSPWDCRGTVVDASYEALEARARQQGDAGPEPGQRVGTPEPPLADAPPRASGGAALPALVTWAGAQGRQVELVHPWACALVADPGAWRLGVVHQPAHPAWPWSQRRWHFVIGALAAHCDAVWVGDLQALQVAGAAGFVAHACGFPGYAQALAGLGARQVAIPRLFEWPARTPGSFSQFWRHAGSRPLHPAPVPAL
jgi:deoxyribodipyrimidine photo-lyase